MERSTTSCAKPRGAERFFLILSNFGSYKGDSQWLCIWNSRTHITIQICICTCMHMHILLREIEMNMCSFFIDKAIIIIMNLNVFLLFYWFNHTILNTSVFNTAVLGSSYTVNLFIHDWQCPMFSWSLQWRTEISLRDSINDGGFKSE